MNKDQQYRNQAELEVKANQKNVIDDAYYPSYHVAPPVGLINDPNGLIQWNGTYHLFYQWMPFKTGHGSKFWGHLSSANLVDWTRHAAALTPSDWFDKDGVYSGSAIEKDDQLYLFYTGNVKTDDIRDAYQCLATSTDGIHFEKEGVQISVPEGFTAHFRDPKVWKKDDKYYMVIGAQTIEEKGTVVGFESFDLKRWEFNGVLAGGFGYMWECPDFFTLDGADILLFSPQGLEADGIDYQNVHQSGYISGKLDYQNWHFDHGDFTELDRGFEFYAPQTTEDVYGRRILIGWMGVPDQDEELHPTHENKWIHQLTLPRELHVRSGHIFQKPVEELKDLREKTLYDGDVTALLELDITRSAEVNIHEIDDEKLHIDLFDYATIDFNKSDRTITLTRPRLDGNGLEKRVGKLREPLNSIQAYIDHSSLEIFVNDGELVFSSRIFAAVEDKGLTVKTNAHLKVYALRSMLGR